MRVGYGNRKLTRSQETDYQRVAVAQRRPILVELAHVVISPFTAPRNDQAKKPVVGTRIQGDFAIPTGIEQICPFTRYIRGLYKIGVIGDGVIVGINIYPAILFILKSFWKRD